MMRSSAAAFVLLTFLIHAAVGAGGGGVLGDGCAVDADCSGMRGGRCFQRKCDCLPYHAAYNNTICLEATLLGYDCLVEEQCSLKVGHSGCLDGVCRCKEGYLQFRKHTCLGPARPGEVCYSNSHCRLWDNESKCQFLIPNLFGRCVCSSPFKEVNQVCVDNSAPQTPATAKPTTIAPQVDDEDTVVIESASNLVKSSSTSTKSPENDDIVVAQAVAQNKYPIVEPEVSANTENELIPSMAHQSFLVDTTISTTSTPNNIPKIVYPHSGKHDGLLKLIADDLNFDDLNSNDHHPAVYTPTKRPTITFTRRPATAPPSLGKNVPKRKLGSSLVNALRKKLKKPVNQRIRLESGNLSLGLYCSSNEQCTESDPNSRCIDGRCDCIYSDNSTSSCSATNTGCLADTFQCRSTGQCISWFFVCDGRTDCTDGSDEECDGARCPKGALRCSRARGANGKPGRGIRGPCVSRSARCDGHQDCPNGEDERNCRSNSKRKCPKYTFQCGDGKCVPEYEFCNAIISCPDGSDEPSHLCNNDNSVKEGGSCPLKCKNGRCRSTAISCSGRDGCGDNTDESACTICRCPARP